MLFVLIQGGVWSWGNNKHGKLGRGAIESFSSSSVPDLVDSLQRHSFKRVRCGLDFSVAVAEDGRVWSW